MYRKKKADGSFSYLDDANDISKAPLQEVSVNEHAKGETSAAVAIDQLAYKPRTCGKTNCSVSRTNHFQMNHDMKRNIFFSRQTFPFSPPLIYLSTKPRSYFRFSVLRCGAQFSTAELFLEVRSRADVSPKAVHRLNSSSE